MAKNVQKKLKLIFSYIICMAVFEFPPPRVPHRRQVGEKNLGHASDVYFSVFRGRKKDN